MSSLVFANSFVSSARCRRAGFAILFVRRLARCSFGTRERAFLVEHEAGLLVGARQHADAVVVTADDQGLGNLAAVDDREPRPLFALNV